MSRSECLSCRRDLGDCCDDPCESRATFLSEVAEKRQETIDTFTRLGILFFAHRGERVTVSADDLMEWLKGKGLTR